MPALAAIGIVTEDMDETVRFYRLLGVNVPEPDGDHLDAALPGGIRLMWDNVDLIRQLDPDWVPPVGHRMGLAFECASPADVDATLPSGIRLMWDTLELILKLDPDWTPPVGHRMGLAFECASPAEVDAVHHRIVSAGFTSKKEPFDAFWGQRYAQVIDPDDNVVDLFAQLPTATS